MDHPAIHLAFDGGTLVVTGPDPERLAALPHCRFDARTNVYRAEAIHYRALVEHLRREKIPYKDEARAYQPTPWPLRTSRDPFPHQTEALETWWNAGGRGVVVLPTGTGKTLPRHPRHQQGRPAGPRRDADHRPAQPVVRRTARRLRRARRRCSAAATTTSSRSPSPPTIPPTSTSNAGATASACWSSTSATTCRGRRTCRRPSAASPRSASA